MLALLLVVFFFCWVISVYSTIRSSVSPEETGRAGKVNKMKLIGWMHRWITEKKSHHHQWFIIIIIVIIIISPKQLFSARWELPLLVWMSWCSIEWLLEGVIKWDSSSNFDLLKNADFRRCLWKFDKRMNGLTDRRTDRPSFRDAKMHLISLVNLLWLLFAQKSWLWWKHDLRRYQHKGG